MKHVINQLQVEDSLEVFSLISNFRSQATANSTLSLVVGDASKQIFTGSTTGQLINLPNATTLLVGHEFEVINSSTVPLTLRDNGGNVLAYISRDRSCKVTVLTIGTANGAWLIKNDFYGADLQRISAAGPTTNNSTTTWVTFMTLTTSTLPLGDYELRWGFIGTTNTNFRSLEFRVMNSAAVLHISESYVPNTAAVMDFSNFTELSAVSGVLSLTLQFRVGSLGGATVTMTNGKMNLRRVL